MYFSTDNLIGLTATLQRIQLEIDGSFFCENQTPRNHYQIIQANFDKERFDVKISLKIKQNVQVY